MLDRWFFRGRAKQKERKWVIEIDAEKPKESTIFHRLNVRFPWLKLVLLVFFSGAFLMDLLDLTISRVGDPYDRIRFAPMAKHVRVPTRSLKGKKLVALTFDDGPSPTTTPILLGKLKRREVLATFFMLGSAAINYPDMVKQVKDEGHEVASHTMYHQNLVRISANEAEADINESRSVFKDLIGEEPKMTRPPYGNVNDAVKVAAKSPLILWSVDMEDWRLSSAEAIAESALGQIRDGSIVLMHDIYPASVDAVSILVDRLRANGYECVTVSELADLRGVKLENGQVYYNFYP